MLNPRQTAESAAIRPIRWLHVSDLHMCAGDTWSQDVVLKAMCDHVAQQRQGGMSLDFVLATGDLAFSGSADEYRVARSFFDNLSEASGVPTEHIFCIPGNHDIDRQRQRMCFLGVRTALQNQSQVDLLLSPEEDLETLLQREENYRGFQASYFEAQDRRPTPDGLAYVSCVSIGNVRIAIAGLDSAWLADGSVDDHGRLLIGERQVMNALAGAAALDPHIAIGMSHHPFHLLPEFDRQVVQSRIQRACRFFHCGHLHHPESVICGYDSEGCLTVSAGASYQTRQSHNTYCILTLDLVHALTTVDVVRYDPRAGSFSFVSSQPYRIELPAVRCSMSEVSEAMRAYSKKLAAWSHYLSALLLDQKAEFLIQAQNGCTFGSFDVIQSLPDSDLRRRTSEFVAFKNLLRVFYGRVSLSDILAQDGVGIAQYGEMLRGLCSVYPGLDSRLATYDEDARTLANNEPQQRFAHTVALLSELATDKEWALLSDHAQRHADSPDPALAIHANRMLALGLAHSGEAVDRTKAIEIYRLLIAGESPEFSDGGNLATLLMDEADNNSIEEAKAVVLRGISSYPLKADYYLQIGQRIVQATGDRDFRRQLDSAVGERGRRD